MLSVRLQAGLRCAEIIRLKVRGLRTTCGCDALRATRKGGKRDIVAIHPETAQHLRACLQAAGYIEDWDGPLLRPMTIGRHPQPIRRQLYPERMDDMLAKYINQLRLGQGYSAHLMRATFIAMALEKGAKPEEVQRTFGHAHYAPTRLYDRRRFMPTTSSALVVSYGDAEDTAFKRGILVGSCHFNEAVFF